MSIIRRHNDELVSNGYTKMTGGEVKDLIPVKMMGTKIIKL